MPACRIAIALAAAAVLSACATSTGYAPAAKEGGYGFSEQRINADRYRVTFRGNSYTSRETVENYLLYRAAEVTLEHGFDYFVITEGDTEANSSYTTTTSAFGAGYGYGYPYYRPFPYYAWGWGWGYPYDSTTRETKRYTAVAYVSMSKGEKPADDATAYNAREVVQNLGPTIQKPAE